MSKHGFNGGKTETKLFILFVLKTMGDALKEDEITEIVTIDDDLNYFEYKEALSELVETQLIYFQEDHYFLSKRGTEDIELLYHELPGSLRLHITEFIKIFNDRKKRNSCITTEVNFIENELFLRLKLTDGARLMCDINMYVASDKQAREVAKNFRKNAENVYTRLMYSLINLPDEQ